MLRAVSAVLAVLNVLTLIAAASIYRAAPSPELATACGFSACIVLVSLFVALEFVWQGDSEKPR